MSKASNAMVGGPAAAMVLAPAWVLGSKRQRPIQSPTDTGMAHT
jgi:hypothetical protein